MAQSQCEYPEQELLGTKIAPKDEHMKSPMDSQHANVRAGIDFDDTTGSSATHYTDGTSLTGPHTLTIFFSLPGSSD
jgi:hypothetical protein